MGAALDPGDHAFASYGPVSNDDLLQYYGFVERDNPSDTYVLEDMGKWLREVSLLALPTMWSATCMGAASRCSRIFPSGLLFVLFVHGDIMRYPLVFGDSCLVEGLGGGGDGAVGGERTFLPGLI